MPQDLALTEAQTQIAELKRMVKQQDGEREDDEKKTSRMEKLQELLEHGYCSAVDGQGMERESAI